MANRQTPPAPNCACCDSQAVEAIARWLCHRSTGEADYADITGENGEPGWMLWADDAHCIIQFMGQRGLDAYVRRRAENDGIASPSSSATAQSDPPAAGV